MVAPTPCAELGPDDVRRAFLRAQGLLGASGRRHGPGGVLARLGAIQLDTISVLARSHELVCYARLGPIGRAAVEETFWGPRRRAFEYWAHAACLLPMESWPLFEFRRRRYRERHAGTANRARAEVAARIAAEGPLTAAELGGARNGGPWWDWSETKVALEVMLACGELVCVTRRGFQRVYDLPERAVPADLLDRSLPDAHCLAALVGAAGARLGVATARDLADYFRLRVSEVTGALEASGLVPVRVAGWRLPAWADPRVLEESGPTRARSRHRTVLLSPFDSLVWDRARTSRVFGFDHLLEAYKPAGRRIHGYYAMPLLAGGRLVGRVDPARRDGCLVARRVAVGPGHAGAAARALAEAASWVGAMGLVVEEVVPERSRALLVAALADLGL